MKKQTKNILLILGTILLIILVLRYGKFFAITPTPHVTKVTASFVSEDESSVLLNYNWEQWYIDDPTGCSLNMDAPITWTIDYFPLYGYDGELPIDKEVYADSDSIQIRDLMAVTDPCRETPSVQLGIVIDTQNSKAKCKLKIAPPCGDPVYSQNHFPDCNVYPSKYFIKCSMEAKAYAVDNLGIKTEANFYGISGGDFNIRILKPGIECTAEKCEGTFYYTCENNKFVGRGEVDGKCGIEASTPGYIVTNGECVYVEIDSDFDTKEECENSLTPPSIPPTIPPVIPPVIPPEKPNYLTIILAVIGLILLLAMLIWAYIKISK